MLDVGRLLLAHLPDEAAAIQPRGLAMAEVAVSLRIRCRTDYQFFLLSSLSYFVEYRILSDRTFVRFDKVCIRSAWDERAHMPPNNGPPKERDHS